MQKLLIIEDEQVIRTALSRFLSRHDYQVDEAGSVEDARHLFNFSDYHLILTDIRLPGAPGTEVLHQTEETPVIIMTAYSSVQSAVEAMQMGAKDYIAKPLDHDELLQLVKKHSREPSGKPKIPTEPDSQLVTEMVGSSETMQDIHQRITKIAPTDATVLILGESGTGKELVAQALHVRSQRKQAPFVIFNCAAVPQNAIEHELFGHSGDKDTGLINTAIGGTLFLDEIGELPMDAQARLLRILQQNSQQNDYDVRIIAATHRDIRKLVQEGSFRSDLYFRIRVMEMVLPPLRDRGDDIIELSLYLLDKAKKQLNRAELSFTRNSIEAIRRYHWPGNVRELSNAIERAAILTDNHEITPELLAIDRPIQAELTQDAMKENLSLEEYFRYFVLEHQNNMTETELAKKLGISRKALWERRQRFGIPRSKKSRG